MVTFEESKIIITIPTPTPGETLAEMQLGIIEALQGVFVGVLTGETLEIDSKAATGFYFLLALLREALVDHSTVEAAQVIAGHEHSKGRGCESEGDT